MVEKNYLGVNWGFVLWKSEDILENGVKILDSRGKIKKEKENIGYF